MPSTVHPCELTDELLLRECDVIRTRRSGPGGQHRNKVETAVVISHRETKLSGEASEKRSQAENKRVALQRLRQNMAIYYRTERGEFIGPTCASRIRNGKLSVGTTHSDFPIVLAEVLDRLFGFDFDLTRTAEFLSCSNSQLLKLLKQSPAAFVYFNQQRQERGLPRLSR